MRVLMVTDLIWPDPGGRAEKMMRHLKALKAVGLAVDVLCPATRSAEGSYSFWKESGRVFRVPALMWPHLRSLRWQEGFLPTSRPGKWYVKLRLPGGYLRWVIPAMRFCWKALKRRHYDGLLCVSNPMTMQLIGLALTEWFPATKLICELRDPMVGYYRSRHSHAVNRLVECWVAKRAALIVEWEDFSPVSFLEKNREVAWKYLRIKNVGFDPNEYSSYKAAITYGKKLRLVYTGDYYGEREPWRVVFRGIDEMVRAGRHISLDYYGNWNDEQKKMVQEECSYETEWMKLHGTVPKEVCVRAAESCHGLIYILDNNEENRTRVSSKLFDYIGSRRPIVALVPKGSQAERKLNAHCPDGLVAVSWESQGARVEAERIFEDVLKRMYSALEKRELEGLVGSAIDEFSCVAGERAFGEGVRAIMEGRNV